MSSAESELASWAGFGGNVGGEVQRQVAAASPEVGLRKFPDIIFSSTGIMGPDGRTLLGVDGLKDLAELPDVVFVSPPSNDNGEPAHGIIGHFLDRGGVVITAEKGALVNHPELLTHDRVGWSAACGGGTGMVEMLPRYARAYDLNELSVTLNGTAASIMGDVAPRVGRGVSAQLAAERAVAAGLAEPGSSSVTEILRAEAEGDVPKKTAILYNALKLGEVLDWRALQFSLSDEQINRALEEGRRLIVSLYPQGSEGFDKDIGQGEFVGGFDVNHDNWRIIGGFRQVGRSVVRAVLENATGANVGFAVGLGRDNENGIYSFIGPGAGAGPTASAMLGDWQKLRASSITAKSPAPIAELGKPKMRVCGFSLEDILAGRVDERALDENTFYAVTNWLTGFEPAWSFATAQSGEASMYRELFAKSQELSDRGHHVRFTPNCVTLGRETMSIRHSDSNFSAVTLWTVRDKETYERFYGPKQLDIWWGQVQESQAA